MDVVGALVDAHRGGIVTQDAVGAGLVGGPRQHHELQLGRQLVAGARSAVRAESDERIVRLQRDEHRAAAALLHQVEAVIEELAEEYEPQVERRRQARVRCKVVGRELGDVVNRAQYAVQTARHLDDADAVVQYIVRGAPDAIRTGTPRHRDRRRVVAGLVDDQVGNDARLRVDHEPAGLVVGCPRLGSAEKRIGQPREQLVRRAEILLTLDQVVERSIDRPQAERHQ